jgi:hypothetical protein
MSVRKAVGKESGRFVFAECASIAVNLGVVAVLDQLIPKEIMHHAAQVVAKTCIEPFQDVIERQMKKFAKLDDFKVDEKKTKEERAEMYAHALMVFGSAWIISWGAKLWTRAHLNARGTEAAENISLAKKINPLNWSLEDVAIVAADEGVHYGSILAMATNDKLATTADEKIQSLTNVLEKTGISREKAKELASYAVIYELPNALGMFAGMGVIAGKHAYSQSQNKFNGWKDIISGTAHTEHTIAH